MSWVAGEVMFKTCYIIWRCKVKMSQPLGQKRWRMSRWQQQSFKIRAAQGSSEWEALANHTAHMSCSWPQDVSPSWESSGMWLESAEEIINMKVTREKGWEWTQEQFSCRWNAKVVVLTQRRMMVLRMKTEIQHQGYNQISPGTAGKLMGNILVDRVAPPQSTELAG